MLITGCYGHMTSCYGDLFILITGCYGIVTSSIVAYCLYWSLVAMDM